mgnify:FL=1
MTDFENQGLAMAIQAFSEGDLDGARSIIEASPGLFGNNARAQNLLGAIYGRLGDIDKAHEIWQAALMIEPYEPTNAANTWANLTGSFLAKGEYEEAIKSANRAIDAKPDHISAIHNRALAYQATQEFEKALADFDQVLEAHPDHASAWLAKGICELRLNNPHAARQSLETSLELHPLNPSSHAQLGAVYEALGDKLMANDSFKRALELAPSNEGLRRAIERTKA